MTTVQIPLDKNPDVAALVAEMEPGTPVYGAFTLKSRDEQTLVLRIEDMEASADELPSAEELRGEEDDEEEDETETPEEPATAPEAEPEKPSKKMMARLNGE
jgi:hypothetical protein